MDRTVVRTGRVDGTVRLDCGHDVEAGTPLDVVSRMTCPDCARGDQPEGLVAYKRTPEFTADTVPAGLLRDHSTKPGVWAHIVVLEGRLRYRCPALGWDQVLESAQPGVVVPEVLHSVEPQGTVRFHVEFLRVPD